MAQKCDTCGKIPQTGNKVSHANNRSKRRWHINLKSIRIVEGTATKSVRLCTRCIRIGNFKKASARVIPPSQPAA